jgi:hypothetical protein
MVNRYTQSLKSALRVIDTIREGLMVFRLNYWRRGQCKTEA